MDHSESETLAGKLALLDDCLKELGRVGIAYSGGVDSTLLLFRSVQTLGAENVVAMHAVSCLSGNRQRTRAENFFKAIFGERLELRKIAVDPLAWNHVAENSSLRCYHCKKGMYKRLLDELPDRAGWHLADGTNFDDIKDIRPGLQAIAELNVATPLLKAGLTKIEIRGLAEKAGLPNHSAPSESCLATRVETGRTITTEELNKIENAENFLESSGLVGTRFRIVGRNIHLEIREQEMTLFSQQDLRRAVQQYAKELGLGDVFVKITGR
jgi:uncharacterized protein